VSSHTENTAIPVAVRHALARRRHHRPVDDTLRAGQLRFAGGRLVSVALVHADEGWVHGCLCDTAPEVASDLDLVLDAGLAAPYPVVVLADLYVQVEEADLGPVVGTLSAEAVRAVKRSPFTDGASMAGWPTGLPLTGPLDWRWQWRHAQIDETMRLSASVRRRILGWD
jgi:hypothetical protein